MTAALTPAVTVPPRAAGQQRGPGRPAVVVPARLTDELTLGLGEDTPFRASSAAALELAQHRPDYADVVVWLSQHLAALDLVVYRAAARRLPHSHAAITAQRARGQGLQLALRQLHAHLNGDGSAPPRQLTRLHSQLEQTLREHSDGERRLLEQLRRALPATDWDALSDQYQTSLAHGPTRPHPFIPHAGLTGRLARRAAATVDRLLDAMESRPVHLLPAQQEPCPAARPAAARTEG